MNFAHDDQQLARFQELVLNPPSSFPRFFNEEEINQLTNYYALVLKWNRILPLTTIIQPNQFLQRHIYESIIVNEHLLSLVTSVWDLGSGVGVPGLVLGILRPHIEVVLVDVHKRKSIFLQEVVDILHLKNVRVVNSRIKELPLLPFRSCITARAVEKMAELVQYFFHLGQNSSQFLFLGGESLHPIILSHLPKHVYLIVHNTSGAINRLLYSAIGST